MIVIFTDGAAKGNPGPGGYGAVLKFGQHRKELSEGFRLTTNNRMELLAVIRALQEIKTTEYPVQVYSDSKYVVDAIEKGWLWSWQKKGFKDKKNQISGYVTSPSTSSLSPSSSGLKGMQDTPKMSVVTSWP